MRDVLSSGVEERVREVADRSKRRHREPRLRGRAVISARVGVRDLALVVESNQTLANHKVPQADSPAEDGAGSLTPFGMTISSSHTPSSAPALCCSAFLKKKKAAAKEAAEKVRNGASLTPASASTTDPSASRLRPLRQAQGQDFGSRLPLSRFAGSLTPASASTSTKHE